MDTKKALSIKDIAKLSGYSVATVSRVLNQKGKYSKETEEKILAFVNAYGYVSNNAAKSLREAKSNTIGLIIPDISNDFYSSIALHLEKYFASQGYSMFICNTANNTQKELDYFKTLDSRVTDGIICISSLQYFPEHLTTRSIPIVCIDRYPDNNRNIPYVATDDRQGAYLATEQLIKSGCKRIINIESYTASYNRRIRTDGYEAALSDYNISIDKNLYLRVTGQDPSYIEAEILTAQFLQSGQICDGIFASSDRAAIGALYALKRFQLDVPEDVQIIGYDNTFYSMLSSPPLSTVNRNTVAMANAAAKLLMDIMSGKELEQRDCIIPVNLVLRSTTK